MTDTIAFIDLQAQRQRLGDRIDKAIGRVLAHGRFIMGPEVAQLEERLADYTGRRHALACSSGTDALALALMAWGIGAGDAVYIPAFTFVATAEVVAWLGATPVFVDVYEDTFNIDPESLQAAVHDTARHGLRPKAVIPVDLFGQPADYTGLLRLADQYGLYVLADAAQGFGGALNGRPAGAFGDAAATSFFPAKPLGCYGDGGAVFTDDDAVAESIRSLRIHGQGKDQYDNVRIGMTGRLDTIQAAILLEKLTVFDEEIEARQRIASRYSEALADVVRVPHVMDGARSAWAQYTVLIERRDEAATRLREAEIPTAIYYPQPLNRQPAYTQYPTVPGGVPVSEYLAQRVLSLPMHPYLDEPTQDRIIAAVRQAVA